MSDPNDTDDGWADLYRELGVESGPSAAKAAPAPVHHQPEPPHLADEPDEDTVPFGAVEEDEAEVGFADAEEAAADDDGADLESGDAEGEEEGAEEAGVTAEGGETGEPGTKKRRRRRRRRGKKKDGETAEGPTPAGESEDVDYAPEASAAADDLPAPESGRELIANWNVPSWQEIVAGLYRPER